MLLCARGRAALVVLAIGVGVSRIWVGMHSPSDVLAEFALGAAAATPPTCSFTGFSAKGQEQRRAALHRLQYGIGRRDRNAALSSLERELSVAHRVFEFLNVARAAELPAAAPRAVESAARAGGVVVAAGDDGTMNAVAQVLLPAALPFGVVPLGTFNYFARVHGIPLDTAQAVQTLLSGREQPASIQGDEERTVRVLTAFAWIYIALAVALFAIHWGALVHIVKRAFGTAASD